ncbi:MAG: TIM barrel protein [Nocardioidaceae bacterium]
MKRGRIAAAPISWGVSEVPGWGHQLSVDRVLDEIRELGLSATEFGPEGFLATEPAAKAEQLRRYGLRAVGGFLPVLLHDPDHDPLDRVSRYVDDCQATGANAVVLAAETGAAGYDQRPVLDELGWKTLLDNLDRIDELTRSRGVLASLHPHIGTMIERGDEVERLLSGARIGLCVDTGHLLAGGTDPVALTQAYVDRVVHVHLKDVDGPLAAEVAAGRLPFGDAVRAGLFLPLGQGTVDIAAMVSVLETTGYAGWYVLEQDVMLDAEPSDAGPIANVRASLDYLDEVAA